MATPNTHGTIRHVDNNYSGCFVACIAMILGLKYEDAYKKLFPMRKPFDSGGCSPQIAFKKLIRLGLQPRMLPANTNIRKLKTTSLIWLRWGGSDSNLMHSIFYEKENNNYWDPNYHLPLTDKIRLENVNRFKENVIALDGYVPPPVRVNPPSPLDYNDYHLY